MSPPEPDSSHRAVSLQSAAANSRAEIAETSQRVGRFAADWPGPFNEMSQTESSLPTARKSRHNFPKLALDAASTLITVGSEVGVAWWVSAMTRPRLVGVLMAILGAWDVTLGGLVGDRNRTEKRTLILGERVFA
jgi:hypothetical protein